MKYTIAFFLALAASANAFTARLTPTRQSTTSLQASKQNGWVAAAAAFALVASPLAVEAQNTVLPDQPTITIAAGAYIPPDSFSSTDLSLPSYDVEDNSALIKGSRGEAAAPQNAAKVAAAPKKEKVAKDETPEQKEARLAKEQKALARAEEVAAEKRAKEEAIMKRRIADQEKAAAMKAEKAAMQQKRLEFKQG